MLEKKRITALVDGVSKFQMNNEDFLDPEKGTKKTMQVIFTSRKPVLITHSINRIYPMGLKLGFLDHLLDGFTAAYIGAYWFANQREIIRLKLKMIILEINKNDPEKPVPLSIFKINGLQGGGINGTREIFGQRTSFYYIRAI